MPVRGEGDLLRFALQLPAEVDRDGGELGRDEEGGAAKVEQRDDDHHEPLIRPAARGAPRLARARAEHGEEEEQGAGVTHVGTMTKWK